ncbi:Lysine-specific demethylase 4D [Frankliniella fusca]|uniref:Lysine-specific demethylase 4D n=1 Tax=Frankliniella fusca TaxID=407009 RepID=A0AAE1HC29_9NEOP|nr:Lysine-specific demethylase 4D [Frankliniella fusca]KAK3918001.1 Lysine-specific demethylase 4D [Frankliniella fusca]
MASIFTITENDLFNFESFCDSKYMDPNCQKYGFFKVKLSEDCAAQCSTLDEFFKRFGVQCQGKIRKAIPLENPHSQTLFGHQNVQPSAQEKKYFVCKNMSVTAFQENQALQESEENFLKHFYSKVTFCPKVMMKNTSNNVAAIKNRAAAKRKAFEKRQLFQEAPSMEGKKRCLEMNMLSERILESSSSQCRCDNCNIQFSFQPSPKSEENEAEDSLLYSAGIEETRNNFLYLSKNFAMAHLCFKNMLADLDSVFGGVSFPALYFGGLHSVFPLHTEDLSCWSFNYVYHGCPKFWYVFMEYFGIMEIMIPPTSVSRLTDALHRKGFYGSHKWCRNTLNHKFYIPLPQFFAEENIPYEVVIQQEKEGIVVLPNTAHTGGNLGPNLAEACNFGSNKWIPYGCVSSNCPCMEDAVHANLTDIVAVHEPTLLKAYLSSNVTDMVDDQYFQKSIVIHRKDIACGLVPASHAQPDHLPPKESRSKATTRIKCPVCSVSWANVQKKNMVAHIVKYHAPRQREEIVVDFLQQYSLSIN